MPLVKDSQDSETDDEITNEYNQQQDHDPDQDDDKILENNKGNKNNLQ